MFDAAAVVNWASVCVRNLTELRPEINEMNVYPVADADTGSNLLHTMMGAQEALLRHAQTEGAGSALAVLARGAVGAAHGNSGVILSQVFRGFAEAVAGLTQVGAEDLIEAFQQADVTASAAVTRPVAGTILSVMHAVAVVAQEKTGQDGTTISEIVVQAAEAAQKALERTPQQLPILAHAGVVDAGGRGLVAVLDALVEVMTGNAVEVRESSTSGALCSVASDSIRAETPGTWEVMYLLESAQAFPQKQLRDALTRLGDSVTVASDGAGQYMVHVHCADIGAAIEAGIPLGRVHQIRVEPLVTPLTVTSRPGHDRVVVAVVRGERLAELLRSEGATVLSVGAGPLGEAGAEEAPTIEEMLGLITESAEKHVTVLTADARLTAVAEQVASHPMIGDREVVVIPCASPVQVLSAWAVHDITRRPSEDVVAMAEAAASTRRGEVQMAREESLTWVGRAQAGDLLGLVDGEVRFVQPAVDATSDLLLMGLKVIDRMLAAGGELVTVLLGAAAPLGLETELERQLRSTHPEVEFASYFSGQNDVALLIGVD